MRWQQDKSLIQDVLDELNVTGAEYHLLSVSERENTVYHWWQRNFPLASWGRVLWSDVPGSVCLSWTDKWKDLVDKFHDLSEKERLGHPPVVIIWSNALKPALVCSLDVIRDHAATIFEADFDTWVLCQAEEWCIEVYHEGEICFGRSQGKA